MQGVQTKVEMKSLEVLEQKIQRAVELVGRLRDENAALTQQLEILQASAVDGAARNRELDAMRITSQQLEKDLRQLQEERSVVLTRVDGLLQDLDRLQLD